MSNQDEEPPDLIWQAIEEQKTEYQSKRRPRILALEYFRAGVPPFQLFETYTSMLKDAVPEEATANGSSNCLAELGFIGVAAYAEAFFKDLFAAAVNICPQLLEGFGRHRDCSFSVAEVLHLSESSRHRIGSFLAEHYDFGSAHSINGIFRDLLSVCPFSKREARRYAEFLNDRNLLVHHGGVYTFKYAGQKFSKKAISREVHWNSLTVRKEDVSKWITFFHNIAEKTTMAGHRALAAFVTAKKIRMGKQRERALKLLVP
jgi:hypothetical protein